MTHVQSRAYDTVQYRMPNATGAAGQVLTLDATRQPVWFGPGSTSGAAPVFYYSDALPGLTWTANDPGGATFTVGGRRHFFLTGQTFPQPALVRFEFTQSAESAQDADGTTIVALQTLADTPIPLNYSVASDDVYSLGPNVFFGTGPTPSTYNDRRALQTFIQWTNGAVGHMGNMNIDAQLIQGTTGVVAGAAFIGAWGFEYMGNVTHAPWEVPPLAGDLRVPPPTVP